MLRIRNVSDKNCRENQNAHIMFSPPPHPPKIVECDLETSCMRRPWSTGGCYAK